MRTRLHSVCLFSYACLLRELWLLEAQADVAVSIMATRRAWEPQFASRKLKWPGLQSHPESHSQSLATQHDAEKWKRTSEELSRTTLMWILTLFSNCWDPSLFITTTVCTNANHVLQEDEIVLLQEDMPWSSSAVISAYKNSEKALNASIIPSSPAKAVGIDLPDIQPYVSNTNNYRLRSIVSKWKLKLQLIVEFPELYIWQGVRASARASGRGNKLFANWSVRFPNTLQP